MGFWWRKKKKKGKAMVSSNSSVGSLDAPLLPWNARLKIVKEIPIAVAYLHTAFPRIIIHRDIKATNVFLDKNGTAELSDLSSAITLPEGKSPGCPDLEEPVVGTLGYTDPTYFSTGILRAYSDVFSYGIFMYEIHFPASC
ncbi:unnamed protein product [Brassica oleracea]